MSYLMALILQLNLLAAPGPKPERAPVYVPICIPGHPKCNRPPPSLPAPQGAPRGRK